MHTRASVYECVRAFRCVLHMAVVGGGGGIGGALGRPSHRWTHGGAHRALGYHIRALPARGPSL